MKKAQVVGALGLAFILAGSGSAVFATDGAGANTKLNTNNGLQSAIEKATEAKGVASTNSSTKYPGLEKYLDQKIAQANEIQKTGNGDSAAMTQVLNEAAEATNLLLGVNRQGITTSTAAGAAVRSNRTVKQSETIANVTPEAQVAAQAEAKEGSVVAKAEPAADVKPEAVATTVKVTVTHEPETEPVATMAKAEATAEDDAAKNDGKGTEAEPEAENTNVEVPNTGEEQRAGVAELIIAGVAVVLIMIGATTVIIKEKKNA